MTISKERFEAIALEIWKHQECMCDERDGKTIIIDFAHALIKRVDAENGVSLSFYGEAKEKHRLIAMPLVAEE